MRFTISTVRFTLVSVPFYLIRVPGFAAAEKAFDFLLKKDPYRIEYIDLFSNILYVTQNSIKLSRLAHEYVTLEKDRPEVCCLLGKFPVLVCEHGSRGDIGNHHSIRAEHTKAIMYFRRATQLDRTFLSAWTLMGHEYVEMKNPHAAVAAYRNDIGTYESYLASGLS